MKRLIKKSRERLAGEIGTIYKPRGGGLRFALAFPNTYYVGMSNLGLQIVYRMLNDMAGVVCERAFLPDPPELEDLRRAGSPLVTMETQTPLREFDVIAFSVSYELDYPNVLKVLSLSGLAELAEERAAGPLVIAGGPAVTINPEPLASFVDAFVIGEAEEVLGELCDVLYAHSGADRSEVLRALSRVDGVYVPSLYTPIYGADGRIERIEAADGAPREIVRRWVPGLDSYDATSAILTVETEFSNMVLVEVARGCGRQCRFCVAGYAFLPPRPRSPISVLASVRRWEERLGGRPRIGLLSASVCDHPSCLLICRSLVDRGGAVSISSTRADTLNPDIAEALHRGGHETLTIAPEAGSERLRSAINKPISDRDILDAAAVAWDAGFRRLKLYFMVGLPTETAEDLAGIPRLVTEMAGMFGWQRLAVSISCFVPKPWTPFQWAPMDEEKVLARKTGAVKNVLRSVRSVEVGGESAREAVVQGILARGDRRLRDVLLAVHREDTSWRGGFRKAGCDTSFYTQRPRCADEVFPWDHVNLGIRKRYLLREYERAAKGVPTPACAVPTCRRCGVCH